MTSHYFSLYSYNQLPGYNIRYPLNEIGDLYREILRDDGVEFSKGEISEATAKGSYRKLIQKANGLKWYNVPDPEIATSEGSKDPIVISAQFTFELESGCYATMMLRELMITTMARDNKME
jgi:tRNA(Glu) U13 pseudouridine synthase TruD